MESNHYVKGSMKQGRDFYTLYAPDGKKIIGLYELPKLIVLAREFDRVAGIPEKEYEQYEKAVWNYSNGKPQYDEDFEVVG